jgi:hypothetical protein
MVRAAPEKTRECHPDDANAWYAKARGLALAGRFAESSEASDRDWPRAVA